MVTLTLGNSYSQVSGLSVKVFDMLKKELSYNTDPQAAYFAGGNFPRVKYLIDKRGGFPTGLLARVYKVLRINAVVYATVDNRVRPAAKPQGHLKPGIKPYPDQAQAFSAAIAKGQGIISAPTGSGKSLIIALIASGLNLKTLIVVPNLEIKTQLRQGLKDVLEDTSKIAVENIDSASLNTMTGFDCLIIDESHHAAAATYQKLNKKAWAGIYYRFFLTATPFRNKDEETLLFEGIAGQVIYRLTYTDAVTRGYIVPIEAYFIESPKQEVDGYTWAQVYSELVVKNQARNALIARLLTTLQASGSASLCLVKEVAHGQILSDLTGIPFVNGKDEDSRKYVKAYNAGKIKTLIATEGIMAEGVDSKPCEYVIIAALGKAKSSFMQKCGRAVRTYPGKESAKVILIKDNSHKWTKSHFSAQVKIVLEEYGVKAVKLDV